MIEKYNSIIKEIKKCKREGDRFFYPREFVSYEVLKKLVNNGYKCYLHQSVMGDDYVFITWKTDYSPGAFDFEYSNEELDYLMNNSMGGKN